MNQLITVFLLLLCPFLLKKASADDKIPVNKVLPSELISFAQSLKGTPYKYASSSPKTGFDCSGFVNYVFRRFDIRVPRSSSAFSKAGKPVQLNQTKPGDLILFTGTNSKIRTIRHIGIILSSPGDPIRFIHCTSGKEYSVTETPLKASYQRRFVKAIRVFED